MLQIEVLHSLHGDKSKNFDTETAEGRENAAKFFKQMLKEGTAIFLERGKKVYRVTGFDAKKNRVKVRVEQSGKNKTVEAKPEKGRQTAIPPQAGG